MRPSVQSHGERRQIAAALVWTPSTASDSVLRRSRIITKVTTSSRFFRACHSASSVLVKRDVTMAPFVVAGCGGHGLNLAEAHAFSTSGDVPRAAGEQLSGRATAVRVHPSMPPAP